MKRRLTLLVASTALTAGIGLPVWSAMRASDGAETSALLALFEDGDDSLPLIRVGGRDDDDDDEYRGALQRGDHDDEDDECDDDDDYENECGTGTGAGNPAPVGTVAPPQNGLFGTGAPPQVQVN